MNKRKLKALKNLKPIAVNKIPVSRPRAYYDLKDVEVSINGHKIKNSDFIIDPESENPFVTKPYLERLKDKFKIDPLFFAKSIGLFKDDLLPWQQDFLDRYNEHDRVIIKSNITYGMGRGKSFYTGLKGLHVGVDKSVGKDETVVCVFDEFENIDQSMWDELNKYLNMENVAVFMLAEKPKVI